MTSLILAAVGALVVGAVLGYVRRDQIARSATGSAEREAQRLADEAQREADRLLSGARDEARDVIKHAEDELRERKQELVAREERLNKREESIDDKQSHLSKEGERLQQQRDELVTREDELKSKADKVAGELERLGGLTKDQAREELLKSVRATHQEELAMSVQKLMHERKEEVEKQALEILTTALQRYARANVSEITTSFFPLRDDDLKGKIIGREGRNIRAIERATGVELLVDESPDGIVISSFDPYRREVARLSLDKLIKDGRIQPAKIEEKVEESRSELERRMLEIGEAAATEVGVYDLPKELILLLGRLHFRTSFGQNVLNHSIEMAHLAGMIAADLGLNVAVAKKGALLHDIGKAIDHEVEGTHVEIGRKLLKKYDVDEAVIEAMQSHHDEYPYARPEAFVVTAVDILSAGRPGARRGTLENYIKRLGDLEAIAASFPGVQQAYALSAGRELRVFVVPEKIDDFRALELARDIANKIQAELKYPGEIKVNVIREVRAVEYAR